jgi:hypothetical protein
VIIERRYNGPPESANGGITAGLVAAAAGTPTTAEVTLRQPPPLATPLTLRDGGAYDGDRLVATVGAAPDGIPAVPPVTWPEALEASRHYAGFVSHPFPTCFVCGPKREAGDGMRIFPGRLPDGRTAAPWLAADPVGPELVWAALDCPGGWSVPLEDRPYVLGRLAVVVDALPAPGDACVVVGRMVGEEGRKAHAHSTLYGPDGEVLARAQAVWIALPTG